MAQYKISLQNSVGEIDCRVVERTESMKGRYPLREALYQMLSGIDLEPGDKVIVTEA